MWSLLPGLFEHPRPVAPRIVEIAAERVLVAVRHLFERRCQQVERVGVKGSADLTGRDRRPVRDRAARAEPQQTGAKAEPQRTGEVAVAFGFVGEAFELGGIL